MRELRGLKRLIAPTAALALFGAVACRDGDEDDSDTDTDATVDPTDDESEDDNSDDDEDEELSAADVRDAIRDLCAAAEACGVLDGTVDECVGTYEEDLPELFDEGNQDCIDAAVAFFSCAAEDGEQVCTETDVDTGEVSFGCQDGELYEDAILACFPEDTDVQDTGDTDVTVAP